MKTLDDLFEEEAAKRGAVKDTSTEIARSKAKAEAEKLREIKQGLRDVLACLIKLTVYGKNTNNGANQMTYTIWSNGGKFEWIVRNGEEIVARSGLVYNSKTKANHGLVNYINSKINMEEVQF